MKPAWLKRAFWAVVVLFITFGVVGAWLAPLYLKHAIEQVAGRELGRVISVDSVSISPYTLKFKLAGLTIKAQDGGQFVSVEEIDAGLSWATLVHWVPVVDHLNITGPKISIARLEANRYDFSDIVDRLMAKRKGGAAAAFVLNRFSIESGAIDFDDRPEKTRHVLRDLRIRVPFLSSVPGQTDVDVEPAFTATVNGMALDFSGKLRPFKEPLGASLRIDFKKLDLKKYVEYVPFPLGVKLASGMVDGDLDLNLSNSKDKGTVLSAKGRLVLSNLDVRELSNAPMIALAHLDLDIAALEPFERSVQIKFLNAEGLDLRIVRRAGGLNLDALKQPVTAQSARAPAEPANPLKFSLSALGLKDARIVFTDETVTPAFRTVAQGITLTVKGLSSEPESRAEIDLALGTQAGETLAAQAKLALAPLAVDARITADKIGLAAYAPYIAPFLNANLEGVLSASANLRATTETEGVRVGLNSVDVHGANLKLSQPGIEILRLGALTLSAADIDPNKHSVTGVEIGIKEGRLELKRGADGELNLAKLLAVKTPAAAADAPAAKAIPWSVDVRKALLEGFALGFEDAAAAPAVRVELAPVSLSAEGLSTRPGVQGRIAAKLGLNRAGALEVSGPLSIEPLAAKLAINAQEIGIVPFQPYFSRFINALVAAGGVSAKGELQIQSGGDGIAATYAGGAQVSGFTLMDVEATQPLVSFKALQFEDIRAASQPFAFNAGPVALSDFYARVAVLPGGRINLQNIIPPKAPATAADQSAAKPGATDAAAALPVSIGRFTLQGGTIEFSDQNIKPNYSARLTDLGGSVAGLSTDPATRADVALKGMVSGTAPLDIAGTVNPLARNLFLDVKAVAKGIDLNPMTPYAARYVGYGIEKGKLSLDAAYHIENGRLDARHKIFLDQLTFGDPVESPEAVKLPVLLAVALLKNSRGEIDIELPIAGSLDDPEFSFGGIIGKVIVNLIVKAVTAPFALLGAIFGGGGEELSYIDFVAGSAALGAAEEAKLKTLVRALADRSGLRLEIIAGRSDAVGDREGLKRAILLQKVRAQKVSGAVAQGTEASGTGTLQISAAEYPALLQRAYDRENFAKPRNALGIARSLPVDEMERLILTNTEIGEQQLRDLARRRVEAVREWLVKSGGIGTERVFLVEPRDNEADKDSRAKAAASRVDLYVK